MGLSLKSLTKNKGAMLESLQAEIKLANENSKGGGNPHLWRVTTDDAGNGSATIRFLPFKESGLQWVSTYDHYFENKLARKTYRELSHRTIGSFDDPMSKFASWLYNAGETETYGKAKAKHNFYANILVVKDPSKPENNGKVFAFKFGVKILDKINAMIMPEEEDDKVKDIFDPIEGYNFRLKVKKVSGFPNYDASKFESDATPIISNDDDEPDEEAIQLALDGCHNLDEMFLGTPPKPIEKLWEIADEVLQRNPLWLQFCEEEGHESSFADPKGKSKSKVDEDEDDDEEEEVVKPKAKTKPKAKVVEESDEDEDDEEEEVVKPKTKPKAKVVEESDDEDEDDDDEFESLLNKIKK